MYRVRPFMLIQPQNIPCLLKNGRNLSSKYINFMCPTRFHLFLKYIQSVYCYEGTSLHIILSPKQVAPALYNRAYALRITCAVATQVSLSA